MALSRRTQKSHGVGSAKIVFSNRSAMSYENLREYVKKVLDTPDPLEVRIEPSVIKPEMIVARQHDQYDGLQAADAVASSFLLRRQHASAWIYRAAFTLNVSNQRSTENQRRRSAMELNSGPRRRAPYWTRVAC
jgi:hypothetical protein